jgi:hypothetical protein
MQRHIDGKDTLFSTMKQGIPQPFSEELQGSGFLLPKKYQQTATFWIFCILLIEIV